MIIKKYISILVCFLCWLNVTETQAQLQEQKHNFSIGISGGVNFSNVDFAPRIKQGYLVGPQMGFTARYISEKYFSMICGIQAEVNYSQRGWKEVIEDNSGDSGRPLERLSEISDRDWRERYKRCRNGHAASLSNVLYGENRITNC